MQKQKDPVKYCFIQLRENAKKRGKEFTLTLDFFRKFCHDTDYIQNRGRTSESFSIDRIDNDKGYTADNIQVLSYGQNSRKHTKKLMCDWEHKLFTVVSLGTAEDDTEKIF